MFGEVVNQKSISIYHANRGWIIKVYKNKALYQVQCSDGNLAQEEIEAINSIIFDASFEIKLQEFVDSLNNTEQTKKANGLTIGVFCKIDGIKTRDIAESLVSLLEQEVNFKRAYIAQNI